MTPAETLSAAHRDLSRIEAFLGQRPRDDKAIEQAQNQLKALKRELAGLTGDRASSLENWASLLLIRAGARL
jgi:hypothetical protein